MNSRRLFSYSLLTMSLWLSFSTHADEFDYPDFIPSQSDFGGVGLMQMPSGRMAPVGEFTVGTTYNDEYQHYSVSLQLMPWLETTVRYTLVQDRLYSGDESFSGDTKYTDKGIDFKLRLFEESRWLPETSIGVRDFGGTGLFDGEFVAASKRFGAFDLTLGVGWGYLGNSGNLSGNKLLSTDCDRNSGYQGKGGSIDYQRWFTGCAAVFGGVEYQTALSPLRLKLEYDGNDYLSDFALGNPDVRMPQSSKWNFGALYRLGDWGDMRLSYERGNTLTAGISLNTNFSSMTPFWSDNQKPNYTPTPVESLTHEQWDQLHHDLETIAGFESPSIFLAEDSVTVMGQQTKYRDRLEATERASLLIANQNIDVSEYRIIETQNHQPLTEYIVDQQDFISFANHEYIDAKVEDAIVRQTPKSIDGERLTSPFTSSRLDYFVSPKLQQSFGGSENFYFFNVGVNVGANYWLFDNVELGGSAYINLYDNYGEFKYEVPPDGTNLKRVRTLVRQYIHDNSVRLDNLQLTWFDRFGDNWYTQIYGGYLETMYGGVGGEVLYRPMDSAWAVGFDVNYVSQRDPDSPFGFFQSEHQYDSITGRPYRVQTRTATGHASLYYQPRWAAFSNTLVKASVGRYLGEDIGVTMDFSKQFDSGVIAGAFVTKTNLSAEEYGEGSFTKGFYISIPFDLMTVKPSTNRASFSWIPLTRDGGQMLGRKHSLFSMTDARSPWYTKNTVRSPEQ